ncbi:hypothetical protein D3C81_1658010 [compost metagenome]
MVALGSTRSLMIFCAVSASGGISMVASRRCWIRRAVNAWTAWVISSRSSSGRLRFGRMLVRFSPKLAALALVSMVLKSSLAISSSTPGSPELTSNFGSRSRLSSYRQGALVSAGRPGSRLRLCLPSILTRRSFGTAVRRRPVSSVRRLRSSNWLCGNSTINTPMLSSRRTACTLRAALRP